MKKMKILVAAAAILVAGTVSAQTMTEVNAKFAEAAAAMNAKNFTVAIPLFEEVIDMGMDVEGAESLVAGAKQNLPLAIFQTGGAAFQGGRLDQALDAFSRAAELSELYGNVQVLNNARCCVFLASGKEKHHVLSTALNLMAEPTLPAQMVRPHTGKLCWVIDEAAYRGE